MLLSAMASLYSAGVVLESALQWRRGALLVSRLAGEQRGIARAWAAGPPATEIRVVLLLPMLREQRNARDLLAAIDRLEFPRERLLVVPITTGREDAEAEERRRAGSAVLADIEAGRTGIGFLWRHSRFFPTTQLRAWVRAQRGGGGAREAVLSAVNGPATREIIERACAEGQLSCPVLHIHYPGLGGNKASQMNHALDVLRQRGFFSRPERTYVGVYDADSRPPRLSLASLATAAAEDPAPAFQQYPIYLSNAGRLGGLMRNEAWLQTARSVVVEYPRQLATNAALRRGRVAGRTFTYCIGHGEFLRADWLLRARFPELQPIDDLPTGYMLSLARHRIVPLPFFDFCEVPDSILDYFRQTSTWFAAQSDYADPPARAERYFGPIPWTRRARGLIEQVAANLRWAARGPARVGALGACMITGAWPAALGLLGAFAFEGASQWAIARRLVEGHLDAEHLPREPFCWSAVARPVLTSVGPCVHLLRRLFRKEAPRYKTER